MRLCYWDPCLEGGVPMLSIHRLAHQCSLYKILLETSVLTVVNIVLSFIHCFHLMPRFRAFTWTPRRQGWIWRVDEIRYRKSSSYSSDSWNYRRNHGQRGFYPTVPSLQQLPNQSLFATMNIQSLDCKISLENHASAPFGCTWDASAFCDTVQAVPQHHRNIQGNVCWLLFERKCKEK